MISENLPNAYADLKYEMIKRNVDMSNHAKHIETGKGWSFQCLLVNNFLEPINFLLQDLHPH